jgi:hypothetical protein
MECEPEAALCPIIHLRRASSGFRTANFTSCVARLYGSPGPFHSETITSTEKVFLDRASAHLITN